MKQILCLLFALALLPGCATRDAAQSFDAAAHAYYTQERTFEPVSITGITELSLKGENIDLVTRAPLNQLSILPKDPDTMGDLINAGASVARFGLGAWAVKGSLDALAEQPRTIEQPAPIIVRPEVIQTR